MGKGVKKNVTVDHEGLGVYIFFLENLERLVYLKYVNKISFPKFTLLLLQNSYVT